MQVRSRGFRTDLMLRRMAGADIEERDGYLVVRTPANPTFYWGNFLLYPTPPQPGDPARWVGAFAQEFPSAEHCAIGVDDTADQLGAADEMRELGFEPDVSVVLVAPQLELWRDRAADVEMRVLQTDEEWAQSVEFRLAVDEDDSVGHRQFVERRAQEFRDLMAAGRGVYVGAFVDGIVRAGLGLFGEAGIARFQNVETHPDFRGRGLASALLVEAARLIAEQQRIDRFVIVADPDYLAIDIYRRLGFRDAERQVQWLRSPQPSVAD